ncbi:hypothetical protein [Pantoea ananatis]|uniref:hypothetical protein n=1 Tax=Pantoea ananas TaxID=553 RepID=UPI001574F8E1|nr:hypothetical protein [Pantoea ananatis]NQE78589.1 hypothetical protein [Pantoea ananatis]NQE82492.1 hypothetical protein [Pantoea ananatis]
MTTNSPNPVDGDVQARKPKRSDHSKLAAEIVHNLVSTDSCDEEVTEKLIAWVLNRLNKEFPTPPAQILRPVELPPKSDVKMGGDAKTRALLTGMNMMLKSCTESLRQQGYEVKS